MKNKSHEITIKRPLFWWVHKTFKTRTYCIWKELCEISGRACLSVSVQNLADFLHGVLGRHLEDNDQEALH